MGRLHASLNISSFFFFASCTTTLLALLFYVSPVTAGMPEAPLPPEHEGVNQAFHDAYAAVREQYVSQLGETMPFLWFDEARLYQAYGNAVNSTLIVDDQYNLAKAGIHAVVGVYLALRQTISSSSDHLLSAQAKLGLEQQLDVLQAQLKAGERDYPLSGLPSGKTEEEAGATLLISALQQAISLVQTSLTSNHVDKGAYEQFAYKIGHTWTGPLTGYLSSRFVTSLHRVVDAFEKSLPFNLQTDYRVVISTSHQRKYAHMARQYFEARFQEQPSCAAEFEKRLLVLDNANRTPGSPQSEAVGLNLHVRKEFVVVVVS